MTVPTITSTITFKSGDVVAVNFPFSDQGGSKRRPGLIIAPDEHDLLLARITTHSPRDGTDVGLKFWNETGLPRASTVRMRKLATIDVRLIHRIIGHLHDSDLEEVRRAWKDFSTSIFESLV